MRVYRSCLHGLLITAAVTLGVLALSLFFGQAGCSTTRTAKEDPAIPLFRPITERGAFRITDAKAESLALKMSVRYHDSTAREALLFAVGQSLAHASSRPDGTLAVNMHGLRLTYAQLAASLARLREIVPQLESYPGLLAKEFDWYRIGPDFGITGYYEPTLKASRMQSSAYPYPLYKLPPDLKKGVAYYTRHEIDRKGALAGRGLEIAWVASEMDAFFLHIQGSGRLLFEDGSVSHVLYAGKNNRAYVSLGRVMREQGLLEPDKVSMQSIRACLLGNPEKCAELYDSNPSYVFFREAAAGPVGSIGRPLTPYVSLATDKTVLPPGCLTFLITPLPDADGKPRDAFYGLTLPQDAGGAIKKHRVDLFCGPGDDAAHMAGYLDYQGALYILVGKGLDQGQNSL